MLDDVHMLVLAALSDGSAASLEEIAARLGVEAGVIASILDELDAAGLVASDARGRLQ